MNLFVPFHDRVLVRRVEAAPQPGGIELPETAKEPPLEGVVLAVGAGRFRDGAWQPCSCAVGQRVLFTKYAGVEIALDGVELLILRDEEVLGRRAGGGE